MWITICDSRVFVAAVLLGLALGCGGDGAAAPDGGGATVCDGDRWGSNDQMLGAIAGCTAIGGNLSLTGNDLVAVELPRLTRVDGFLTVWGNAALTRVSLPNLARVGGFLEVSANRALTILDLPALVSVNERDVTAVHDLVIRDNAALPNCRAVAVHDRLRANGFQGSASISGNAASCPP